MKDCNNCKIRKSCVYKGIIVPCDDWKADGNITRLRRIAFTIVNKPMTYREHQFVQSCTTNYTFTSKQEGWLSSINKRVG